MGTWSLQTLSVKNIDGRIVVYFYGMFNNGEHMQHMQVGRCHHCRCHHRRCATLISVKAFTKYPFFLWLSPFSHKPSIGTIMAGPPLVRKLRKAVYGRILNYNFDIIDTSTCSNECSGHGMWVGGGAGRFRDRKISQNYIFSILAFVYQEVCVFSFFFLHQINFLFSDVISALDSAYVINIGWKTSSNLKLADNSPTANGLKSTLQ